MKKHKFKIIGVFVIIALLTGAWFYGGDYNKNVTAEAQSISDATTIIEASDNNNAPLESYNEIDQKEESKEEKSESQETLDLPYVEDVESDDDIVADSNSLDTTHSDSTNESLPLTTDNPQPIEPQDATISDDEFFVTLSVRCDTILNNMNLLNREKHELVPADGIIFPTTTVTAYEGESVFNVLQREMRRARIHMEFRNTPLYNSSYVMGINNLYEFDTGELSGWMYKVNDWFPNYGSSRYQLKPGDVIEWAYTCDLGRDVGEVWLNGRQSDE
jgi:hypothetical protein